MFDFFLIAWGIRTTSIRRAILFLLEHLARKVRREILGKGDEIKVSGGTAR